MPDTLKIRRADLQRCRKVVPCLIGLVLLVYGAVGGNTGRHGQALAAPVAQKQSVHVPFRLEPGGAIGLDAEVNGKVVPCIFDTGTPKTMWPSHFSIGGRRTGVKEYITDFAGKQMHFETVVLPSLKIGGFTARNLPGYELSENTPELAKRREENTFFYKRMMLSNQVFAGTSVTIDYEKQVLTITPIPASLPYPKEEEGEHLVLNFTLETPTKSWYGLPVVKGSVEQVPVRIMVDTAWTSESAGVSFEVADKIKTAVAKSGKANGQGATQQTGLFAGSGSLTRVEWFPPVQWKFDKSPQIAFERSAYVVERPSVLTDAVIGWSVLRHYRVTINYVTQQIILQPVIPLNSVPPRDPSQGFRWRWYSSIKEWAEVPQDKLPPTQ